MKRITVGGVQYEPVIRDGEKLMIVSVDNRGLTFIGRVKIDPNADFITIRDARCIIVWGTSKHIAELIDGPTDKTKLGATADVLVSTRNIIFAYEVNKEAWS